MLRKSCALLGFVRGGFAVGSRGGKHQGYAPTQFLYRFAGKQGPGPVLMKYWWTLGCFPTGLEVPFRLGEFHQTYVKQHVPQELEEWLMAIVKDPVEIIVNGTDEFVAAFDAIPEPEATRHRRAQTFAVHTVVKPLQVAFHELGVEVPAAAVRGCAAKPRLRRQLLNALHDYSAEVKAHASTPHRRWAAAELEASDAAAAPPQLAADEQPATHGITETGASSIGAVLSVDKDRTARDEHLLVEAVTTLAEASDTMHRHDHAASLLRSAFRFAHDDRTKSNVHANLATSLNKAGEFKQAEEHAKEAVLLSRSPRGFANWSVAVAYQDDYDTAGRILEDGLAEHPDNVVLQRVHKGLARAMCGKETVRPEARGARYHTTEQTRRGSLSQPGIMFDNQFDLVRFEGRLVPFKLDPTTNSLGSIMRRAGNMHNTGITSTSLVEPV
jgi:tetratricopeptide (TPR) repeat protein